MIDRVGIFIARKATQNDISMDDRFTFRYLLKIVEINKLEKVTFFYIRQILKLCII